MADITEDEIRDRVKEFLAEHDPSVEDTVTWRGALFDAGLAIVHFPEGKGGLGASRRLQTVVNEELRRAGARLDDMSVNPIGIGMGMPTVLAWGTEEMHARFLRPCYTGEEVWCQLFSEPGAGSDVAGLSTRAVRDGDEWIVSGQKVWTSLAHKARWGMLLCRTDPDQPKHKGMSYFVVDMHLPGVEVRPLYQITGDAEFNEVFFNEVRVPHSMMLGKEGDGWNVAVTTLMNERVALGGGVPAKGSGTIATLMKAWQQRPPRTEAEDAVLRDLVTRRWIEAEVLRLTNIRARALAGAGVPGPEGSIGKLFSAELNKRITETVVDVMGAAGMLMDRPYQLSRPDSVTLVGGDPRRTFLRMRANTIEGGTSEIMRNILGERVLGLPGEPRTDKDVPWSEIPRTG